MFSDSARTRRVTTTLLVALLCLSVLTPAVAAVSTPSHPPADVGGSTVAQQAQSNETATNTTANGTPPLAEQTRISAVTFDKPYLSTSSSGGDTYNVSGPYAVFSASKSIEAAKIEQPKASAKVMDGGRTIRVSFAEDAAPADGESFYELTLYFRDDSSRTLSLYVSQTDQIVASAQLREASGFIEDMKDDAEAHGFEPTIDGIEEYHDWEKKQADLFSNFLGPKLERLFFAGFAIVRSSLAVILLAAAFILGALYVRKVHGWKVEDMVNGGSRTEQKRQEFATHYRETHDKAASEPLHKVEAIGKRYEGVIVDTAGDRTVKQWADRLAHGEPVYTEEGTYARDDDGDIVWRHHGIDDLVGQANLRDTWAEPYLRDELFGDAQTFATIAKQTLERMADHHALRQYDTPAGKARALLEQVETGETNRYDEQTTWSDNQGERSHRFGPGPAGGDD